MPNVFADSYPVGISASTSRRSACFRSASIIIGQDETPSFQLHTLSVLHCSLFGSPLTLVSPRIECPLKMTARGCSVTVRPRIIHSQRSSPTPCILLYTSPDLS